MSWTTYLTPAVASALIGGVSGSVVTGQASTIGDLAIAVGIPALVLGIALYIAGLVRDSLR